MRRVGLFENREENSTDLPFARTCRKVLLNIYYLSGSNSVHKDETERIRKVERIRPQQYLIKMELGGHITGV